MYQQLLNRDGTVSSDQILRRLDGAFIPFDDRNPDYAEYLKWLGEGNTPLPADQPTA